MSGLAPLFQPSPSFPMSRGYFLSRLRAHSSLGLLRRGLSTFQRHDVAGEQRPCFLKPLNFFIDGGDD